MNLLDLLKETGGEQSVGQLASRLNLGSSETKSIIDAVAPALMRSLQKGSGSASGLASLTKALESGNHARYIDRPEELLSDNAVNDGNKILGHLFGSKDVSRNVAANAAEQSGVDASLVKKALPLLAGLAMGALNKKSDGGRSAGSALPGLLGGLAGGDDGKFGVDDVLSMARKFF